jgi:formylmethanofuran dehydrogenase subunit B
VSAAADLSLRVVDVQALLQLLTDLNGPGRRWYAIRMRVQGNVVGADSVLLWQTGYPVDAHETGFVPLGT